MRTAGARVLSMGAVATVVVAGASPSGPTSCRRRSRCRRPRRPTGTLTTILVVFILAAIIILPSLGLLYVLDQKEHPRTRRTRNAVITNMTSRPVRIHLEPEPRKVMSQTPDASASATGAPRRAPLVLAALILAAAVANLNLAVANVALPTIGRAFDASQAELNLIAVGYSLGLAASVLYLGAIGDRFGRKQMLLVGSALSIPLSFAAAYAPNAPFLIVARILGGVAGGMCYPTTLALIAALWSGPGRTRSIALWGAIGAAFASLGPLLSGVLLDHFWWGSVFLVTVPIAVAAFAMAWFLVPAHVNETTERVDNLGGVLSVAMVGALILGINFAVVPNAAAAVTVLFVVTILALVAFVVRQRHARNPLYDLHVAARPTFWTAAVAGIIVFGSLMGAMFIGQQYLQNVSGYSTVEAGAAIIPAAVLMVLVAPRSAKLVGTVGSRNTLLFGYVVCAARLSHHAAVVEGGLAVLEGRPRVRVRRHRRWFRGDTRRAFPHRLRPRQRESAWHRVPRICNVTSVARSCNRSSARCSQLATRAR